MNSQKEGKKYKRRRLYLALGGTLAVFWLLTIFWGTKQVHRDYVQLEREGLPESVTVFVDRKSVDKSTRWEQISDPWAPLPFVVSFEVDTKNEEVFDYHCRRFYFFWCLGYHPEWPFFGRYLPETFGRREIKDQLRYAALTHSTYQ
ncbi:hypothetical protein [uncultured Gimesia sp.]|uniref:hypothetical protein n=1 Tax=uncultured Gimesia sp. TaxID=1678688 RepID=UPI00262BF671|nr:hypothetical protein [uncultured Gimesia sp.]